MKYQGTIHSATVHWLKTIGFDELPFLMWLYHSGIVFWKEREKNACKWHLPPILQKDQSTYNQNWFLLNWKEGATKCCKATKRRENWSSLEWMSIVWTAPRGVPMGQSEKSVFGNMFLNQRTARQGFLGFPDISPTHGHKLSGWPWTKSLSLCQTLHQWNVVTFLKP